MTNEQILKEVKSIKIRAMLLQESATRLEERITEGVSTPSLSDRKLENVVFKRKKRIKNKTP